MTDTISDIHILEFEEWNSASERHKAEVSDLVDEYLTNKQHQFKNPVIDFLFTYYNYRAAALKKWSPGTGVLIKDGAHHPDFHQKEYSVDGNDVWLDPIHFPEKRRRALNWILSLLKTTHNRQPMLNCCGLHEWAMVYKAGEVRHQNFPLRLSPAHIQDFVDSHPVVCTHFDAFRFFTPEAMPLNRQSLSRDTMLENEQPGCLHTNMDLYKWAFKLSPWVSSTVILDAFKLAMQARTMDMKAGPYDLSAIGYEPIPIETESGRIRYKQEQAAIWKASIPVREALINELEILAINTN